MNGNRKNPKTKISRAKRRRMKRREDHNAGRKHVAENYPKGFRTTSRLDADN